MDILFENCCGVDVHKKLIVACFFRGKEKEIREFGATTQELQNMADWLTENHCEAVVMESTGSYWKPLYNMMELHNLNPMVVNPQHMKAVPGHKTDVGDAEWIGDLARHGLLKPSFIPSRDLREAREIATYRKKLIHMRTEELNRLQKMLEGGNIKLSGTISDINGMSGRALLEAMLADKDVSAEAIQKLAEDGKISKRLKASYEQLAEDMRGTLSVKQKQILRIILTHIDELNALISEMDELLDDHMNDGEKMAVAQLEKIPGIGHKSAQDIISVIGVDMSRFPSASHLASWMGLCPGNNESAGKRKSGKTCHGNWLGKTTMVICAHAAVKHAQSYFASQFRRLSQRRGKKRAYVAVAHSMAIAIWHMLSKGEEYRDLGGDYYDHFNIEKKITSLRKRADKLKALLGSHEPVST